MRSRIDSATCGTHAKISLLSDEAAEARKLEEAEMVSEGAAGATPKEEDAAADKKDEL